MLEAVEPDLHLVTLLVELNRALARCHTCQCPGGGRYRWCNRLEQRLASTGPRRRSPARWPARSHAPPTARRHRLGAHHPRQPAALPAAAPHRRAREGGRATVVANAACRETSSSPSTNRAAWPTASCTRPCSVRCSPPCRRCARGHRVRHGGRRPHAPAPRPGRGAVRRAARRRHRHRAGGGLLPATHHPPGRHRPRAGERSVRGRQRRPAARAGSRCCIGGCHRGRAARSQRRGRAGTTTCRPPCSSLSGCRAGLHARRVPRVLAAALGHSTRDAIGSTAKAPR